MLGCHGSRLSFLRVCACFPVLILSAPAPFSFLQNCVIIFLCLFLSFCLSLSFSFSFSFSFALSLCRSVALSLCLSLILNSQNTKDEHEREALWCTYPHGHAAYQLFDAGRIKQQQSRSLLLCYCGFTAALLIFLTTNCFTTAAFLLLYSTCSLIISYLSSEGAQSHSTHLTTCCITRAALPLLYRCFAAALMLLYHLYLFIFLLRGAHSHTRTNTHK
jgi:hypothetical protein